MIAPVNNDAKAELAQSLKEIQSEQQLIKGKIAALDFRIEVFYRRIEKEFAAMSPPLAQAPAPPLAHEIPAVVPPPLPKRIVDDRGCLVEEPVEQVEPAPPVAVPPLIVPPEIARVEAGTSEKASGAVPPPLVPPKVPETPTNPAESQSLEQQIGEVWMVRVGVVLLLTGIALFGGYAFKWLVGVLGAAGKLALLALAGGAMTGLGLYLEKTRESMKGYARVLIAGGVATLYFTTYAAHFLEPLRVITNPLVGGLALLAVGGGIAWFAERRRSEEVALLAISLSYVTSAINPVGAFTLFSNFVLTAAGLWFLVRHRWARLSWLTLLGTYGSTLFWVFRSHELTPAFTVGFLSSYWLLYTGVCLLALGQDAKQRTTVFAVNNAAFFFIAEASILTTTSQWSWTFPLFFGALLLLYPVQRIARRLESDGMESIAVAQGLTLVILAMANLLAGPTLAIVLAAQSLLFLFGSRHRHTVLLKLAALASAVLASGDVVLLIHSDKEVAVTWIGLLCAAAFGMCARLCSAPASTPSAPDKNDAQSDVSLFALSFSVLSVGLLCRMILHAAPQAWQIPALALVPLLVGCTARFHGSKELAMCAQLSLVLPFGILTFHSVFRHAIPPWHFFSVFAIAQYLSFSWERGIWMPGAAGKLTVPSFFYAGLATLTAFLWLWDLRDWEAASFAACVIAASLTAYSLVVRSAATGICAQAFTVMAISGTAWALQEGSADPLLPLGCWLTLTGIALASEIVGGRWTGEASAPGWMRAIAAFLRIPAAVMLAQWVGLAAPSEWRVAILLAFSAAHLVASTLTQQPMTRYAGVIHACLAGMWYLAEGSDSASIQNLIAPFMLIAACIYAKHRSKGADTEKVIETMVLPLFSIVWLFIWLTHWHYATHATPLTVAWTFHALGSIGLGLAIREKIYRLSGFVVLVLTLGRLFFVDVWQLESLGRIASFVVLGVALMTLGFFYNRFSTWLKKVL